MADTMTFTPQQVRWMLQQWQRNLQTCIDWLDRSMFNTEKPSKETEKSFVLLKQNLAMLRPYMSCLASAVPVKIPDGLTVTKCAYVEPDFVSWRPQIAEPQIERAAK